MSLFQSNLREQNRKLPNILKSVKTIHYHSILLIRVLTDRNAGRHDPEHHLRCGAPERSPPPGPQVAERGRLRPMFFPSPG